MLDTPLAQKPRDLYVYTFGCRKCCHNLLPTENKKET